MALEAGTRALLSLFSQQAAPSGFGAGGTGEIKVDVEYGSGVGDRLAEAHHKSERSLVGAGTELLDLTTLLDSNGAALAAAQVSIFALVASADNVGNLQLDVGNAVATSWTALLSASGVTDQAQLDLAPGAGIALISFKNGAYPVSGTDKIVQVTNLDATNEANYELLVLASRT